MQPRRARLFAAESDVESAVDGQKERAIRFRSLAPGFVSLYGADRARWVNVLRLHSYAIDESLAVVLPSDTPQQTVARIRLGGEGALQSRLPPGRSWRTKKRSFFFSKSFIRRACSSFRPTYPPRQ